MGGSAECDVTQKNEKTKSKTANDTNTRFIITPFFLTSRLLLWLQNAFCRNATSIILCLHNPTPFNQCSPALASGPFSYYKAIVVPAIPKNITL
jgi:hypothetical protein